jgi:hypothetical protein
MRKWEDERDTADGEICQPEKIGRNLRRFRALKLLKSVAGTRKYYLTKRGLDLLIAGRQLTERIILPALAA